jgi:hypothetical protein
MAGLEADTSSYPKPTLPVSPLDTAQKLGGLQQQKQQIESGAISIDKQKLDLMNTQFTLMNQELSTMIDDPNITKPQAAERLNRFATTLKLPPEATKHMMDELNAAPSVKAFSENALRRGMDTQQRINQQYGTTETISDQSNIYQGVRAPAARGGGFQSATKLPVQIPPGTPVFDQQNQQVLVPPSGPAGVVPAGAPSPRSALPAARPTTGPTGPTVDRTAETPTDFNNRFAGAYRSAPAPLFNEGKEAYTKAQLNASARAQSIKPAIQALKLMPGLATGPGTEQFNTAVAGLKAWGLVDTKTENDPTVIRQELNKKLAQYVGNSPIGQRSDAQQALAEAGSPNPKVQLTQALQNLTRDAVALDRVQILKPNAFKGRDYENYIKHEGNFPQSVDEKALTLDLMDVKERDKLVSKMKSDYKNGDASAKKKAVKFFETLQLAKDAKIYDTGE